MKWKFIMNEAACPEFGLHQDRQSYRNYASSQNCCFHCARPASVSFAHQEQYCLTSRFEKCPVFQSAHDSEFPGELQGEVTQVVRKGIGWPKYLLIGLGLCFAFFMLFSIMNHKEQLSNPQNNTIVEPTATKKIVSQSTDPALEVVDSTSTVTPLTTDLPSSSGETPFTPTIFPSATVNTVATGLIIHQVQDGESLEFLSEKFNTTPEAIKAINYGLPSPIWSGWTLVIPEGKNEVNDFPVFEVFYVAESMSADKLIQQKECDPVIFREYNALQSDLISAGQWVLIPRG